MHGAGWEGEDAVLDRMPVKSTPGRRPRPGRGPDHRAARSGLVGRGHGRAVEVSADAGQTWHEATLTGPNEPSCWVGWELAWTPPRAGDHELWVRATDSLGRCQPEEAPDNDDGYFFSAVVRHPVDGGAGARGVSRTSAAPGRLDRAASTRRG